MDDMDLQKDASEEHEVERRKFLAQCGRFAIATPPAITLLMSTSLTSQAIAKSGGGHGRGHGNGNGNGKAYGTWKH